MDVVMWQITCGRILFPPLSEHYIPIPYLIDFLVQEADAHSFCRLSPEFPLFVDDLVGVLLIDFRGRYMKLVLQLCNVQSAVSLLD